VQTLEPTSLCTKLTVLGLFAACRLSLVTVCGLLIAAVSLDAEHRLYMHGLR